MALIVSGIKIPLCGEENDALKSASKILGLSSLKDLSVYKRSVDARKKNDIKLIYSVLYTGKEKPKNGGVGQVAEYNNTEFSPDCGTGERTRPIIVGFGPAGMFAALLFAKKGYKPIVLERGAAIPERKAAVERLFCDGTLDINSNIQFGAGGAGTFSDGKLTTRINSPLCSYVINAFAEFGAPEEIKTNAKPHIGTDNLCEIVSNIAAKITALGGEIRYNCAAADISEKSGFCEVVTSDKETLRSKAVIVSVGHSARDTFEMLLRNGFLLEAKAFACGFRIEHKRSYIDKLMYGDFAGHPKLGAADYHFAHNIEGRGVYTFCMCPGGLVIPAASGEGEVVVNGMSSFGRDAENSNSAVVVGVSPNDFGNNPLSGIAFQKEAEKKAFALGGGRLAAPFLPVSKYLGIAAPQGEVSPSYLPAAKEAEIGKIYPEFLNKSLKKGLFAFERKAEGFITGPAILTGAETRTSSPVRIKRGENYVAADKKFVYPCGEGAGYSGGIMSAAVDGLKVAASIIENFAPPK